MRRFFARSLLFVVGINLLIKPAWIFIIDRTVQNRVAHGMYGTYQALLSLSIVFQTVLDFGLNNYNSRTLSQEPRRFATQFPALLGVRFILMGVYLVLELIAGLALGYHGWEIMLLCGTALMQSLAILHLFIRSNIAAFQRFRLDGVLSVTDRLLMIVLCGSVLFLPIFKGPFKIEWFIGLQILCYALAILTGLVMLHRITHTRLRITFGVNAIWSIIKQGAPYALLTFLMAVYMRGDATILERIIPNGKIQGDSYAKSLRLLDTVNMIPNIMAGILLPMFGAMLAKREDFTPIIRLSINLLLPVMFLGAAISVLCGTEILQLLYKNIGFADGQILAWLIASLPAFVLMYVYSTLLTANGDLRLLCILAGCGAVASLVMNFILVPRLGALGTAITAFTVESALAIAYVLSATKRFDLPKHPKWIAAHLSYIVLLGIGCIILLPMHLDWKVKASLIIATGGILIICFRFISVKSLQRFLLRQS